MTLISLSFIVLIIIDSPDSRRRRRITDQVVMVWTYAGSSAEVCGKCGDKSGPVILVILILLFPAPHQTAKPGLTPEYRRKSRRKRQQTSHWLASSSRLPALVLETSSSSFSSSSVNSLSFDSFGFFSFVHRISPPPSPHHHNHLRSFLSRLHSSLVFPMFPPPFEKSLHLPCWQILGLFVIAPYFVLSFYPSTENLAKLVILGVAPKTHLPHHPHPLFSSPCPPHPPYPSSSSSLFPMDFSFPKENIIRILRHHFKT